MLLTFIFTCGKDCTSIETTPKDSTSIPTEAVALSNADEFRLIVCVVKALEVAFANNATFVRVTANTPLKSKIAVGSSKTWKVSFG